MYFYIYYFYYSFIGYPFLLQFAVFFLFVFSLAIIIAAGRFSWVILDHYRKKRFQQRLYYRYLTPVTEVITARENFVLQDIAPVIRCNVKNLKAREKRILTNILLRIRNREKRINEENFRVVVDYFEIRQFWEKKMRHGRTAMKLKALRKLDELNIAAQGSIISPLTYSRNPQVRKKARVFYMLFSKTNPFKFLEEDFDPSFDNWDKVEIHRVLVQREDQLPLISQWLKKSDNPAYQAFMIDEIRFFNQQRCIPYLLETIRGHDAFLRERCIEALAAMDYKAAEADFMREYPLQPLGVQKSIIRAIRMFQTGKALFFLEDAYRVTPDVDLKMLILRAVLNYGAAGKELFYMMQHKAPQKERVFFDHVSNPLIKYY